MFPSEGKYPLLQENMPAVFRTGTADPQRLLAQSGPQATAHVSDRVPPVGHIFMLVTTGLCLGKRLHFERDYTVSLVS